MYYDADWDLRRDIYGYEHAQYFAKGIRIVSHPIQSNLMERDTSTNIFNNGRHYNINPILPNDYMRISPNVRANVDYVENLLKLD